MSHFINDAKQALLRYMEIKLETKRLILREIIPSDVDSLFELDSNSNVHKYVGNKPVQNKEEIKTIIQNLRQQYIDNGIARLADIDKITNEFYCWA